MDLRTDRQKRIAVVYQCLSIVTALGFIACGVLLAWAWQINFWLSVYLAIAFVFGVITLVRIMQHS